MRRALPVFERAGDDLAGRAVRTLLQGWQSAGVPGLAGCGGG
jgi:hypothetical protein